MIIDRVEIEGFGRLCDRTFSFAPTLNVVVGRNEAGKSTLLESIQELLYGQFRDSAAWSGERARERYRPWSGAPYAGSIQLRLGNGDCYRIARRFDDESTTVLRGPNAHDVTASYSPGPHGWVEFGDQHLGLTPAVFRACAYIEQADVAPERDDVKLLHARLKALADSGGVEKSALEAINTLDAWLLDRKTFAPLGSGTSALDRARATVRELDEKLRASRVALDDLAGLVADQARLKEEEPRLRAEIEKLDRLIAWREAEALEAKLRSLADAERRLADRRAEIERHADVAALTGARLDEAEQALQAVGRLRREVDRIAAQIGQETDERVRLDRSLKEIAAELQRLPPGTRAPFADFATADAAVEQWASQIGQCQQATDSLADFRQARKEATANLDSQLRRLSTVPVEELRRVVRAVAVGQSELEAAEQQLTDKRFKPEEEAEYQALLSELRGFSDDELFRMQALERDLKSGSRRRNGEVKHPIQLATAVGAVVGLGVGYGAFEAIGAVVGSVGLGAGAYGLMSFVSSRRAVGEAPGSTIVLDNWLVQYGARSVDELRRRWDRLPQLQSQLAASQRLQEKMDGAQKATKVAVEELERIAGTPDVAEAEQALARLETWASEQAVLDQTENALREELRRTQHELDDGQREARAALERLGITAEDPPQARRSLEGLRADREQRETFVRQQTELQDELGKHEQTITTLAERRSELASAEDTARERLAIVGIMGGPETWAVELARRRERFSVRENAVHDLDAQEEIRRMLVGSDNPDEWWPRMAEQRSVGIRPDPEDTRTLDELRTEARQRRDELTKGQATLAQIDVRRQERSGSLGDPAALEEELDEATAFLTRLERRGSVLQEARALILAIAEEHRRNFAPRLADSVSNWLELATAHRYARAEVSPTDLSVALASRDRGGLVTLDHVSRGTRDAVALLFRASVVDLLSNTGEPVPLFLDDPLVNVDAERAQSIFAILGELAQTRQIFYCTHDHRIVEWVQRMGECRVLSLDAVA